MSRRRSVATAWRVLLQLSHDRRTLGFILAVPSLLMVLLRYVFDAQPQVFLRVGPMLLALFPFVVMFVTTSVAMLRERSTGTLERLLSTPIGRADILAGYALAFGAASVAQVGLALAVALGPLGLTVHGSTLLLVVFAVVDALLGMSLGLLLSAFARTEFQAVQFLPAVVLPQFLLCGLLVPRDAMPRALRLVSDVFPLSYAVDGAAHATGVGWDATLVDDLAVVCGCVLLALALGAATLRRRTE